MSIPHVNGQIRTWASMLLTSLVAIQFAISASLHIKNPYALLNAIDGYQLVSSRASVVAASLVPFFEIALGAMLLLRIAIRAALLLSLLLLGLFVSVQVSVIARGLTINCGCYGPVDSMTVGLRSITYTTALLLLLVIAATLEYVGSSKVVSDLGAKA